MSDRPRLVFDRLDIRRMPGIETGFSVDGLSAGVNVIYGPNGSGKTSLTRALATLLWKQAGSTNRSIVSGAFSFNQRAWQISYDAGYRKCQADGLDADFPRIDAADDSARYLLALHDLLQADDKDFAAAILRESTGGFDINAAAGQLGYAARPATPRSLERAFTNARDAYRTTLGGQEALRQRERERETLLEQQQEALAARQRYEALIRVREFHAAQAAHDEARQRLERFPSVLATLTGTELDELSRLRDRNDELEQLELTERQTIARAQEQQVATQLTEPLLPTLIGELRQRCQRLRELERDLQAAADDWDTAEAQVATARRRIGPEIDDERLAAFDPEQLDTLARLMRESQQAYARFDALRDLAALIPVVDPGRDLATERERLALAIRCLHQWLRQPGTDSRSDTNRTVLLLVAAGLAALEALLLGVLVHPAFFVLLVVSVALLGLGVWVMSPGEEQANHADRWRAEYEALGLPAPAGWEPRAVEARADDLVKQLREIESAQATRERWQHVHHELPTARQRAEAVDAQIFGFVQTFGITHVADISALHVLANAIVDWQRARGQADAARTRRASIATRYAEELATLNRQLLPYGDASAADSATAIVATDILAQRESERASADAEERRSTAQLAGSLRLQRDNWQFEFNGFFDRYELEPADEIGLRSLLDQQPEYRDAKADAERAALELERAQRSLGDAECYIDLSSDDLFDALQQAKDESERLDDIRDEIATIAAEVNQAKKGKNVEGALAELEIAADALRDARELAERQISGWTLADFVSQRTRDVDRPQVFHRARELFARITQGRYELHVGDSDQPTFRAVDTDTGTGHGLDELSSGTRLQLLLAVRVAFVEQQERGPMLPLILDETLGNSDEHRARAIIDATIQIARDGRQVLYLTAQHDEVHKWAAIMQDVEDVPIAIVDLAEVRGLAEWERLPSAPPQSWVLPNVPAPNGHSRDAYRELLHVPGIDLTVEDTGGLHLWHLIDDLDVLHGLLSIQIETWGQLRTLVEIGGRGTSLASSELIDQCRARVQVIDVIASARRVGMGRPVDRAVLLDSGAISDIFLERVVNLANELGGDGQALIAALDDGRISRFHTSRRDQLDAYLEEQGYIDRSTPLTIDTARAHAFSTAGNAIERGLLTAEWVNQTLQTLWRVSSAAAHEMKQREGVR